MGHMTLGRRFAHYRTAARVVAGLLAASLCLTACGDPAATGEGGSGERSGDGGSGSTAEWSDAAKLVGVDRAALRGEGTTLAPGVEVAAGSELVGAVVPYAEPGSEGQAGAASGWRATFLVTGDPIDVWRRYATALDIPGATAERSCTVSAVTTEDQPRFPTRLLTEARLDRENLVSCSARVGAVSLAMEVGAARCRDATAADCELRPVANLLATVGGAALPAGYELYGTGTDLMERCMAGGATTSAPTTTDPESAVGPTDPGATSTITTIQMDANRGQQCFEAQDPPAGPIVAPDLDLRGVRPTKLPGVGDPIDDGIDGYGLSSFVVPEGGRSLVAPSLLIDCNSGLVAALQLAGTPAQLAAHLDAASDTDDPISTTDGVVDGRPSLTGLITTAGGYYLSVSAVAVDDGTTDALITECGD